MNVIHNKRISEENKNYQRKAESNYMKMVTTNQRKLLKKILQIVSFVFYPLKIFGYTESHLYIEAKIDDTKNERDS